MLFRSSCYHHHATHVFQKGPLSTHQSTEHYCLGVIKVLLVKYETSLYAVVLALLLSHGCYFFALPLSYGGIMNYSSQVRPADVYSGSFATSQMALCSLRNRRSEDSGKNRHCSPFGENCSQWLEFQSLSSFQTDTVV